MSWAGSIVLDDAQAAEVVRHADDRQLAVDGPSAAFVVTGWSPGTAELRIRGTGSEPPFR
ncbi:hypothetical protein AB0D08_34580 [Kitasatospora sp. NPDC048540]|uniref:hypothetical protein n=1 Tax=Kitasatospora sp. NPDC048540 TaxID=3155634 RepID=UPI0033CE3114